MTLCCGICKNTSHTIILHMLQVEIRRETKEKHSKIETEVEPL